jgi:hypothetical protein
LSDSGASGLTLSVYANLSRWARTLPGTRTARDTHVLAIAELAGRTATCTSTAGAADPDLTLAVDTDLTSWTRALRAIGTRTPGDTDAVGIANLSLRAGALRVVRRTATDARTRPGRGVT